MLPTCLLLLVYAAFTVAQGVSQLPLGSVSTFSGSTLSNPARFTLPIVDKVWLTVALCSSGPNPPKFILFNDTAEMELVLDRGNGNWTGSSVGGINLRVEGAGSNTFEIAASDTGPMHEILETLPRLGDTTSNQVILFSPPFLSFPKQESTYPNYVLPEANTSAPEVPAASPNYTMVIGTGALDSTAVPLTGCGIRGSRSIGNNLTEAPWFRDGDGWRRQWLVGGLTPLVNYTAFLVQDDTKISGPIHFVTKSALFACSLVYNLPYCPTVNYAVPLAQPPFPAPAWDATNLPTTLTAPLIDYLTNFTTTLTSFACGRDMYSPLQSCADCQRAYRTWLCTVSFPRCSETSPSTPGQNVTVTSALVPRPTTASPRNPNMIRLSTPYTELLPCLETCMDVDRACPVFLGFKCPVVKFNARDSYGVGYIDSGVEGEEGGGTTGQAQDIWGNVWCNRP